MKGKLYVMGAPMDIFRRINPELQKRIVYLSYFMNFPKNKFKQITRFLTVGRITLPKSILAWWFDKKELDRLQNVGPEDNILLYECTNTRSLKALRHILPKEAVCHIYYCNPIHTIFNRPERDIERIRKMGFSLSSFDPYDAEKYQLDYAGQYFCYPEQATHPYTTSDCFFCGLPKDRNDILTDIRNRMSANGFICDFVIPRTPAEKISYTEYLKRLSRTRCVIDISQKGQYGLTRRPLEALFYGKKLITNNEKICEYDFYHQENIFIYGKDPTDKLNDFMVAPMKEVPANIKDKYDINQWISQFLT